MSKNKLPFIIGACILIMLSLTGYLVFHTISSDINRNANFDRNTVEASSVSPGAIGKDSKGPDSSDNNTYIPSDDEYDNNNNNNKGDQMSDNEPTKTPWTPATEIDLDPNSITVYVNREHSLPKDYVPEDLVIPNILFDIPDNSERNHMRKEAADAIEELFAAALQDGYTLYGISGYRSYRRQKEIFLNNIIHKGKNHTLKYSAIPGTSEHQTGLVMDVSSKSVRCRLITSFANCDEGKWLARHSHEFGFIIRYPQDKTDITGYAYEPWHIRYVGKDLANYLYTNNLTLDEYYNYKPSEDFDFEKKYASLINYKPPVTPTPIPEDELEDDIEDEIPLDELPDVDDPDEDTGDEIVDNPEDEETGDESPDNPEDENSENTNPEDESGNDFPENPEDESPDYPDPDSQNPEDNPESGDTIDELVPTSIPADIPITPVISPPPDN